MENYEMEHALFTKIRQEQLETERFKSNLNAHTHDERFPDKSVPVYKESFPDMNDKNNPYVNKISNKEAKSSDEEEVNVCSVMSSNENINKNEDRGENSNRDKMDSYSYEVNGQNYTIALGSDPCATLLNNEKSESNDSKNDGESSELYSCNICSKQYRCPRSLKRHSLTHTGEKPHECNTCGKRFALRSYLTTHLKTHKKETFNCTFCDKKFASMDTLKLHLPVHVVDRMLNLEEKNDQSNGVPSKMMDMMNQLNPGKIAEMVRNEEQQSKKRLLDQDEESQNSEKRFKDSEVDRSDQDDEFMDTDKSVQSLMASTKEKFEKLKALNRKDTNVLHDEAENGDAEEEPTEMYIKTELIEEVEGRLASGEGIKEEDKPPVSCGFCNEQFAVYEDLEKHMELHKETNTYTYEVDGQKYTVSLDAGGGPSSFLNASSLAGMGKDDDASRDSTGSGQENNQDDEEKPYKCHICPKQYNRPNSLKRHIILHSGEKPHVCTYCDKRFALMSYLTEHMKMHTGGLPFTCNICHKQFNRLANMKVHMGVHEKEKQDKIHMQTFQELENQKSELVKSALPNIPLNLQGDKSNSQTGLLGSSLITSSLLGPSKPPTSTGMHLFKPYMLNYLSKFQKLIPDHSESSKLATDKMATPKTKVQDKPSSQDSSPLVKGLSDNILLNSGAGPPSGDKISEMVEAICANLKDSNYGLGKELGDKNDDNSESESQSETDSPMKVAAGLAKDIGSKDYLKDLERKVDLEISQLMCIKKELSVISGTLDGNTDPDPAPPGMYNYVVDGKTYTIPIPTLDPNMLPENSIRRSLIQSFEIKPYVDPETGKKIYSCEICFKSYNRSNSLRRHLMVHTGEKAYACDLCDKQFSIKSYLTAHRKIHSGETPFGCSFCGKQFNRVSNLRAHMLVHTGVKPFSCQVCGKLFNLSSNLKRHMTIHTGIKPHICSVCGKEFGLSSSLKEHMRVHTGENPYKCDTCGKQFKQHSNFRRHKSIHTGEKKHHCHICNKAFNQSGSLKRHLTIHSEAENGDGSQSMDYSFGDGKQIDTADGDIDNSVVDNLLRGERSDEGDAESEVSEPETENRTAEETQLMNEDSAIRESIDAVVKKEPEIDRVGVVQSNMMMGESNKIIPNQNQGEVTDNISDTMSKIAELQALNMKSGKKEKKKRKPKEPANKGIENDGISNTPVKPKKPRKPKNPDDETKPKRKRAKKNADNMNPDSQNSTIDPDNIKLEPQAMMHSPGNIGPDSQNMGNSFNMNVQRMMENSESYRIQHQRNMNGPDSFRPEKIMHTPANISQETQRMMNNSANNISPESQKFINNPENIGQEPQNLSSNSVRSDSQRTMNTPENISPESHRTMNNSVIKGPESQRILSSSVNRPENPESVSSGSNIDSENQRILNSSASIGPEGQRMFNSSNLAPESHRMFNSYNIGAESQRMMHHPMNLAPDNYRMFNNPPNFGPDSYRMYTPPNLNPESHRMLYNPANLGPETHRMFNPMNMGPEAHQMMNNPYMGPESHRMMSNYMYPHPAMSHPSEREPSGLHYSPEKSSAPMASPNALPASGKGKPDENVQNPSMSDETLFSEHILKQQQDFYYQ